MNKKKLIEKQVIDTSKIVLQAFYSRKVDSVKHYLADNFLWVGAFDYQYTKSKEDFLKIIQSEIDSTELTMLNEELFLVAKDKSSFIVFAKFKLIANTSNNILIKTHTRLTMVWNIVDGELKLCHVHGSNAHDIPLSVVPDAVKESPHDDFVKYIMSLDANKNKEKLSFRLSSGTYKYFLKEEIFFIKADLQNSIIFTGSEEINISGLLSEQEKKLSDNFYRIHKSYIINTNTVTSLKRYKVTLTNGVELPVSKEKFMAFREFLNKQNNKGNI